MDGNLGKLDAYAREDYKLHTMNIDFSPEAFFELI